MWYLILSIPDPCCLSYLQNDQHINYENVLQKKKNYYAPNFEKLKGHISLDLSVRPSVRYKFKIGF